MTTEDLSVRMEAITQKEYFSKEIAAIRDLIELRDRLYTTQFEAAAIAVNAALAAQEKAVNAAFLASEKAIVKAEDAQREYNARSNEFRGQLSDQAQLFMARLEAMGLFKGIEEKLELVQAGIDVKIENIRKDIKPLSDSRSEGVGRASQSAVYIATAIAASGFVIGLLSIAVTIAVRVFS